MAVNFVESDETLWAQVSLGNEAAEEELIKRYSVLVRILSRPYFLAGGDSEDLIQEGMLGLLSAVRHYDPSKDAGFKTYAELCIKNRLYSAIRSAQGAKQSPLNDYVPFESPQFDECQSRLAYYLRDPEELLISKERLESVKINADRLLSKFESQVLELYLEGLSYVEIAVRVKKSAKSVDNAVQRIRKKLMQHP